MRARVLAALLSVVLLAALAFAPAAGAHGEDDPAIRTVVDGVQPALPGVTVRVAPGVAKRLDLANRGPRTVELLGPDGKPWLRVGPGGVQAQVTSRTWLASGNPDGVFRRPRSEGPQWRRVSSEPRWVWFAHELHPDATGVGIPPQVAQSLRPARLGDWRIGLRVAGDGAPPRPGRIAGHLEYRPARGNLQARLTSPVQLAPGVTVSVLPARAPGLFVANTGDRPVVVMGGDGRPFARVSSDRTELNLSSSTYRAQPQPAAGPPAPAGEREVRWREIPSGGTVTWIEPRAGYGREEPPEEVLARREPTVLVRWTVGTRVGGRPRPVRGETVWVPLASSAVTGAGGGDGAQASGGRGDDEGAGGDAWLLLPVLAALVGGAFWLRRRGALRSGAQAG